MSEEQVLTAIEKMGEHGTEAFSQWMDLRWAEFWFNAIVGSLALLFAVGCVLFLLKILFIDGDSK